MNATGIATFYKKMLAHLGFAPTALQDVVLQQLAEFAVVPNDESCYMLAGYAGTGKTTLLGALTRSLPSISRKAVQLAPTGRAAKVIAGYSKRSASTIHREIYTPKNTGGRVQFALRENKHTNSIFIVDEASMIPDRNTDNRGVTTSLLDDLIEYVYSGQDCHLLLVGDTAQLPPVKLDLSPALDAQLLEVRYDLNVTRTQLTEVVRQAQDSGILTNATVIREHIVQQEPQIKFDLAGFSDVLRMLAGNEVLEAIEDSYSTRGHAETTIIVRSNKRANLYNQQIRSRVLFRESEISPGDLLMVVKNNYFWVKPNTQAGFIANGDIIEVLELYSINEVHDLRFASVRVQMVDYPDMRPFEVQIVLDTLDSDLPALTYQQSDALYKSVAQDYAHEGSKSKQYLAIKRDPFFNALQVKFSYAITCHKSQGGQWARVFVEQPYLAEGPNTAYLRWLYTAVTRTTERLYLLGFGKDYFNDDD